MNRKISNGQFILRVAMCAALFFSLAVSSASAGWPLLRHHFRHHHRGFYRPRIAYNWHRPIYYRWHRPRVYYSSFAYSVPTHRYRVISRPTYYYTPTYYSAPVYYTPTYSFPTVTTTYTPICSTEPAPVLNQPSTPAYSPIYVNEQTEPNYSYNSLAKSNARATQILEQYEHLNRHLTDPINETHATATTMDRFVSAKLNTTDFVKANKTTVVSQQWRESAITYIDLMLDSGDAESGLDACRKLAEIEGEFPAGLYLRHALLAAMTGQDDLEAIEALTVFFDRGENLSTVRLPDTLAGMFANTDISISKIKNQIAKRALENDGDSASLTVLAFVSALEGENERANLFAESAIDRASVEGSGMEHFVASNLAN